ncbi:MAG: serine hydrolase [Rickettsiales bacterium]|nr:serine hydrolase [Rickettsiales bacterium]
MVRLFSTLLTSSILLLTLSFPASASPKAVLVADMKSGTILYQENGTALNYPASLTKLMTLYLTFDALTAGRLREDQNLIVSSRAASQPAIKLDLKPGEKISVETAIKALVIRSANDVASVLSENLKGDEGDFADTMTRIAAEIGLKQTEFHNSSGLPDDDQVSSARDLALLSIAIYQHFPQYFHYFSAKSFKHNGKTYDTHNHILNSYPGANGMKTGFTNKARYNLSATAKKGKDQLVAIVLGADNAKERTNVATKLLDYGFALKAGKKPGSFSTFISTTSTNPNYEPYDADEDYDATYGNGTKFSSQTQKSPSPAKSTTNKFPTNGGVVSAKQTGWLDNSKGKTGVQFGAFGSKNSAQTQADRVKRALGVSPVVEKSNGLYRVRLYGLSESTASKLNSQSASKSIPSFIFR